MLKCDKSRVFVPSRGKVLRSELTLEDQLAEAGWLLSLLALTEDQLALLAEDIQHLHITGPPGTGEARCIQSFRRAVIVLKLIRRKRGGRGWGSKADASLLCEHSSFFL